MDKGTVTPATLTGIIPGIHTIKLILSGYQNWSGTATVIAGLTTNATAIMVVNSNHKSQGTNTLTLYNNLFNPKKGESVTLKYKIGESAKVTIKIYTLEGELVKVLVDNEYKPGGEYSIDWFGKNDDGEERVE